MKNKDDQEQAYGTTWAGAGSNNLDTMETLFVNPGSNCMLSATGILNATTSLEAERRAAPTTRSTSSSSNEDLRRDAAGLGGLPLLCTRTPSRQDYIPDFRWSGAGGRTSRVGGNAGFFQTDRGPFTNVNTTYDALANLTKIWGSALRQVRRLLPEQLQAPEHLRELQQPDQLHRRRQQPVRHGLRATRTRPPASSTSTPRPRSTPCPSGATRTSSGTPRTTGRPARS